MLLRNFNILTGDPENREVFSRPPLVAYRRDSNLRDMLVRTFDSSQLTSHAGTLISMLSRSLSHLPAHF